MSRSSNSLRLSDVTTTPIKLKYTSSYDSNTLNGAGIKVYEGVNGPITSTGSISAETAIYRSVKQLYYSSYTPSSSLYVANFTGSFPFSASSANDSLQSTAAFGTLDADVRNFPTTPGAAIRVISIPRNVYGERISRGGFFFSSSAHVVIDDGNGNLIDGTGLPYVNSRYYTPEFIDWYAHAPIIYVGNIFYSQGIAVITNPAYIDMLPYPPTAVADSATFTTATTNKTLNLLTNDVARSGTLVPSSVVVSGPDAALFTNNLNGTITLNTNTIGTYTAYYTVDCSLPGGGTLTSNLAQIQVSVTKPPCNCTTYTVTSTTSGTATFTYESCTTRTIISVTLTGLNASTTICACNGQVFLNTGLSSAVVGTGCVANCNVVGNVIAV